MDTTTNYDASVDYNANLNYNGVITPTPPTTSSAGSLWFRKPTHRDWEILDSFNPKRKRQLREDEELMVLIGAIDEE